MKIRKALALSTLGLILTGGLAFAEDHHDNHAYVRHDEWRKGARMNHDDWNRGERIDYRRHHLSAPPHGHEGREGAGNYFLAAAATGLISSVIVASTVH